MKVVSYSLWGDDKLYCQGAIDNIECAKEYSPDWVCRFYISKNCPALPVLQTKECQIRIIEEEYKSIDRQNQDWHWDIAHTGMLWRFLAIEDPEIEYVIFRDTDSRLNKKEAYAVQEWIESGLVSHRMHECKEHWNAQMMGGMWGIRGQIFGNIENAIKKYVSMYTSIRNEPWIFVDLWFIMDVLWPYLQQSCMGHGYNHAHQFQIDGPMVGAVVHEEWRGQKYVP